MNLEDLSTQTFHEEQSSLSGKKFISYIPLQIGDMLCGIYSLTARLGRGGMGEVWLAEELFEGKILRQVVIKTILPEVQNTSEEMARVEEMFHKIHGFQHEHICPMYALKSDPKVGTFLVMKYIHGKTLNEYWNEYMKSHTTFPISEVVRLLLPVAQALDYSHSKMVLHRDIKPQNILISDDPNDGIQLIDFGLVIDLIGTIASVTAQTRIQSTAGTLPYMSPEQLAGTHQTEASDQYSLAVVAYELIAGVKPFTGDSFQNLGFQIMNSTPALIPGISFQTNAVLQKGLAKSRRKRWKTCTEFIEALGSGETKNYYWSFSMERYMKWGAGIALGLILCVLCVLLFHGKPEVKNEAVKNETVENVEPEVRSEKPEITKSEPPASIPEPESPQTRVINGVPFTFCWCPVEEKLEGLSSNPYAPLTPEKGFWMLDSVITQKQWAAVMGGAMAPYVGDEMPMTMITFAEIKVFAKKLAELLGTEVRVPNEVQWEYAARAGKYDGDGTDENLNRHGWYWDNSDNVIHPCRTKEPNEWGLYDMQGNVWEFVIPENNTDYDEKKEEHIAIRGGCTWCTVPKCAFSVREVHPIEMRLNAFGVRLILPDCTIPPVNPKKQVKFKPVPVKENTVFVTTVKDEEDFTNNEVSLREALMAIPENGTVRFDKKLDGAVIHVGEKPIIITKGVKVDASDLPHKIILDGDKKHSLVFVGYNSEENPVVLDSLIFQNAQGKTYAALGGQECTLNVKRCVFRHCIGGSAPVVHRYGGLTMENCLLEENESTVSYPYAPHSGGVAAFRDYCRLTNCRLIHNKIRGDGGGFTQSTGNGDLINCLFVSNSAVQGGAVSLFNNGNNFRIKNCTFVKNSASRGGCFIVDKTNPKIQNSILVHNQGGESPEIHVIEGKVYGSNNISDWTGWAESSGNQLPKSESLFIDEKNEDFHLGPNSQAIEAGRGGIPAETDLDGNARISGLYIDAGVYEFQK